MAMPSSGEIKFSQLQTEFGGSNPIALSEYYGKGNAPSSGEIQLGADFYGTSSAYTAEYLIIAGGGAGGGDESNGAASGGGGAGGYRSSVVGQASGRNSPAETQATVVAGTVYTITVGAGGAKVQGVRVNGNNGSNSSAFGVTSLGGGGGMGNLIGPVRSGGSGGGADWQTISGGSGTSGQGYNGSSGSGAGAYNAGAGGGAGGNASGNRGGAGLYSNITGTSVARGGGGGGACYSSCTNTGGVGGGGNGGPSVSNGTNNTGGGGGGEKQGTGAGRGGSGIVILRIPTANYSGIHTGSPTVTTSGSNTILQFTGSGSYTG